MIQIPLVYTTQTWDVYGCTNFDTLNIIKSFFKWNADGNDPAPLAKLILIIQIYRNLWNQLSKLVIFAVIIKFT